MGRERERGSTRERHHAREAAEREAARERGSRERGSTREREEEREATMASMGHQKTLKKQYSSAGSSNSRTRSSSLPEKRKDEPRDWRKALRSEGSAFTPWGE